MTFSVLRALIIQGRINQSFPKSVIGLRSKGHENGIWVNRTRPCIEMALPATLRPAGLDNPEAVADKGQVRQAGIASRVQAGYVQVAVGCRVVEWHRAGQVESG
jgi:hypothetical protein